MLQAVGDFRSDIQQRLPLADVGLQPSDAGRAVIGEREAIRLRFNQMHWPIDSAIDRKISAQRCDVRLRRIAHVDGEEVRAVRGQIGCDFKTKRTERAAMFPDELVVQINVRHRTRRLEPQKIAFALLRCDIQSTPIPARPAVITFPPSCNSCQPQQCGMEIVCQLESFQFASAGLIACPATPAGSPCMKCQPESSSVLSRAKQLMERTSVQTKSKK